MSPIILLPLLLLALPAAAQTPAPAPLPPTLQTHPPDTIGAVLGRRVMDANGEEIGRLVDILIDRRGRPRAAVIDAGGFMGIGMRRVAVAWEALRFTIGGGETGVASDLTLDEVAAAAEFKGTDSPVRVIGPRRTAP